MYLQCSELSMNAVHFSCQLELEQSQVCMYLMSSPKEECNLANYLLLFEGYESTCLFSLYTVAFT